MPNQLRLTFLNDVKAEVRGGFDRRYGRLTTMQRLFSGDATH